MPELVGRGVWGVRVCLHEGLTKLSIPGKKRRRCMSVPSELPSFPSLSRFDSSQPYWPLTFLSSLSSRQGSQTHRPTGPSLCSPGKPYTWLPWGSCSGELGPSKSNACHLGVLGTVDLHMKKGAFEQPQVARIWFHQKKKKKEIKKKKKKKNMVSDPALEAISPSRMWGNLRPWKVETPWDK